MKNKYEIIIPFPGYPFVEVWGEQFLYSDLYEIVGKQRFMTTFTFKKSSKAYKKYKTDVTGTIFYSREELIKIVSSDNQFEQDKIRIEIFMDMEHELKENIKYGGISISDIKVISFTPYKREIEYYASGEKKVPNIIYIDYRPTPNEDYELMYHNLVVRKYNYGTELIEFEKEKLIGITLGKHGKVDASLLIPLGYNKEKVINCKNIWYHAYLTKERRKTITNEEKGKLKDLKFIFFVKNLKLFLEEIIKCKVNMTELQQKAEILKTLMLELEKFEPHILLYGKKQIYWDIQSYLHIVLRHVKQLQLGTFKAKSSFPYKHKDLEVLIEQVLRRIEDEIRNHFEKYPEREFRRAGKMSVLFNNDYYSINIDRNGRLTNIYINN